MLSYAEETIRMSISVLVEPVSCCPSQQYAAVSLYALGPVDPAQITPFHTHLSSGEACSLLVPVELSPSILAHPRFKEGYKWGYLEGNPEDEEWTVPKLVNEIYHNLAEMRYENEPNFYPWTLGVFLGVLASLVEQDKTLALTGLAHVCFLLPLLTRDCPPSWPRYEPYHAGYQHRRVLKAYRARVRFYREQGKSFAEAQRLALGVTVR